MKIAFCCLIPLLLSIPCVGQRLENYTLKVEGVSLPLGSTFWEEYSYADGKLNYQFCRTPPKEQSKKEKKRCTSKRGKLSMQAVHDIDSLFREREFRLVLSRELVDSIKNDSFWMSDSRVTKQDMANFFSHGDTVIITSDTASRRYRSHVLDGAPFTFRLILKRQHRHREVHEFKSNLGGVERTNFSYWLALYIIHQRHHCFESGPVLHWLASDNLRMILRAAISDSKADKGTRSPLEFMD